MSELPQRDPIRGFTFAFIGMVLLSCNFVTVKYGLQGERGGFNPESLTVIWMGAATFFAALWTAGRRQLAQVVRAGPALRWLLALGVANACCQLTAWHGLQRLDPSFAAFLGRFAPMTAIIMGALILKEHIRPAEWLAIAVIVGGGALSTLAPGAMIHHAEWIGIGLSLAAAFLSAVQWPIAKHCGQHTSGSVMNFYRVSVAAVVVIGWGLATHTLNFSHARTDQWIVTILGAFLGPFLSYVFTFYSYRYWDMSRSAVVWTLQPLVVVPLALAVFGTTVTGWKLIGGLVMLGGAFCLAALHRKVEDEIPEIATEIAREIEGEVADSSRTT